MNLSEKELREIETQLSCPNGENGIMIANTMNETNITMTTASINQLNLKPNEDVLEIGHGNCDHLKYILEKAENLKYVGLEISETMQTEAKRINSCFDANFLIYDGLTLPFGKASFDKIFTVNTVYFWKDAIDLIQQIEQILKPGGTFILTFATKSFMQDLPFVNEKFQLFNESDIKQLITYTQFRIENITNNSEVVTSKTGEEINRNFIVLELRK